MPLNWFPLLILDILFTKLKAKVTFISEISIIKIRLIISFKTDLQRLDTSFASAFKGKRQGKDRGCAEGKSNEKLKNRKVVRRILCFAGLHED